MQTPVLRRFFNKESPVRIAFWLAVITFFVITLVVNLRRLSAGSGVVFTGSELY